ncbi:MAG TPA: LysE family transporter [Streptosporangiales bacterium]
MTAALVAGLLAGYGIAVPIGAVGTYLVALTARTSLRVGVAAALGVATVDGAYALAAVAGGAAVGRVIEPFAGVLRWASAAVLTAMAAHTVVTAVRRFRTPPAEAGMRRGRVVLTPVRAYPTLVAMTVVNPTTVVYFTALVLGSRIGSASGWTERVTFVVAAFVASASWQLLLAGGGALLGRAVAGRRRQLGTALASGALIVALAVRLLLG